MTFASLDAFLSDLASKGYHLTSVSPWETSYGSRGSVAGVDAVYTRVIDGTARAVCRARLLARRFSYGLDRVVDDGTVTASFASVYGSAIYTKDTTFPTFDGADLGAVVA